MREKLFLNEFLYNLKFIVLTFCISIIFWACAANEDTKISTVPANSLQSNQKDTIITTQEKTEEERQTQINNSKGISFSCFIPSVSKVEVIEREESFLKNETDIPDGIQPQHFSIKFKGDYTEQSKGSYFPLEVRIYPVKDYRNVLIKSNYDAKSFDQKISALQHIISTKPSGLKDDIPFIKFVQGRPDFITHLKYISFKNGEGLIYLTHYSFEPTIINNQALTYLFQGFTKDGKYYVLATFPVSSKALPKDRDVEEFDGYKIPDDYNDPKKADLNWKNHQKYISAVKKLLESEKSFEPDLYGIEESISSLEIKKYNSK